MAAPTTAARTTSSFDRHYATTIEEWDPGFEDIAFEEFVFLWILNQVATVWKTGGRDYVTTQMAQKNSSAKFFSGADQLTPPAEQGPNAAVFAMKNAVVSIQEFWEDSIVNSGEFAMIDRLKETIEKASLSMGELLDAALKSGSVVSAKAFSGLEQAVYYESGHSTNLPQQLVRSDYAAGGNGAFTANNTYGGIDRSIDANLGSYGWRNLTMDLSQNTDTTFSLTSEHYKAFRHAYNLLTRGSKAPDLCLMTLTPFEHFEAMFENGMVKVEKGLSGESGSVNIPFETIKWKNLLVMKWEGGTYGYGSSVANSDGNAADQMIYMLATWTWKWVKETQAWFAMTPWITPEDQLARVSHLVCRSVPVCVNPRYNGVLGEYE